MAKCPMCSYTRHKRMEIMKQLNCLLPCLNTSPNDVSNHSRSDIDRNRTQGSSTHRINAMHGDVIISALKCRKNSRNGMKG